jgi:hypothetical protein
MDWTLKHILARMKYFELSIGFPHLIMDGTIETRREKRKMSNVLYDFQYWSLSDKNMENAKLENYF